MLKDFQIKFWLPKIRKDTFCGSTNGLVKNKKEKVSRGESEIGKSREEARKYTSHSKKKT